MDFNPANPTTALWISGIGWIITFFTTRWYVSRDLKKNRVRDSIYSIQRNAIYHWHNIGDKVSSDKSGNELICSFSILNNQIEEIIPRYDLFDTRLAISQAKKDLRQIVTKDFELETMANMTTSQRASRIDKIESKVRDILDLL